MATLHRDIFLIRTKSTPPNLSTYLLILLVHL